MVRVIERRELAETEPCMEIHVHPLPQDKSVTVARTIFGEPLGYGHRRPVSRLDIPVAEAFLGAVKEAGERGIPFVRVNDPHRLFPPDKRLPLP